MGSERTSNQLFFAVSALLFIAGVTTTIVWSRSMTAMDAMPMPGGWTMSMTWMPGQMSARAAAALIGMWIAMTAAMMLPSLVPMLWRYRQAVGHIGTIGLGWLTALVGAGYFTVWGALGLAVFAIGAAFAGAEMDWPAFARAAPVAGGVLVIIGGALQFTRWKLSHLACCRTLAVEGRALPAEVSAAWRYGLTLGVHCFCCCAGLMAVLLVIGLMDLRVMAVVTAAITIERVAPDGEHLAGAIGVVAVACGAFLIVQAAGI